MFVNRLALPLCLPLLTALACHSQAQETSWSDVLAQGDARLFFDNQYFARDFRDGPNNAGRNRYKPRDERNGYRQEWGQSVQLHYHSGFTPGLIGLGVDAFAMAAFKLDSGGGRTGTGTLAVDGQGHPRDSHGKAGGAFKLKIADAQLKYGNFSTQAPVLAADNSRIIPGMAHGLHLQGDWAGLKLEAARLTALSGPTESKSRGAISTVYGRPERHGIDIHGASYLGASHRGGPWSLSYYLAQLEDVWTQHYLHLGHERALGAGTLSNSFDLYRTRDSGDSLFGPIDNLIGSHAIAYRQGPHRLTLAYQRNVSDTPFDYIGFGDGQSSQSIVLANAAAYSDFNGPRERSWQLRYDQRLNWLGLPELNLALRYQRGLGRRRQPCPRPQHLPRALRSRRQAPRAGPGPRLHLLPWPAEEPAPARHADLAPQQPRLRGRLHRPDAPAHPIPAGAVLVPRRPLQWRSGRCAPQGCSAR
ncbi:OprD family outer membrane porin [Pseudomonas tohonis]|uniref:OprD family outer membrane porin n=1 Tax=Pseudomonas tohonis TaxID=2725477 RepID=UPI00403B2ED7